MKKLLTIAGSDCSGGAGIQADLKTFAAHGAYGMSVIVSVVAENTTRVISMQDISPDIIKDQLDAVLEDITVDGVKIGMLSNTGAMIAVAEKLKKYKLPMPVIDPVMAAKGGFGLISDSSLELSDVLTVFKREIIPLSYVLTPNIPEAEALTGMKISNANDMKGAAVLLYEMGAENVLIKGGHLNGDAEDILYDGERFYSFVSKRIHTMNTHGTGCTLSSAITANLANGLDIVSSVAAAKEYVTQAIKHAQPISHGHGPTNHFYNVYFKDEHLN